MNQIVAFPQSGTDPKSSLPPALSRDDDVTRALLTNGRSVEPAQRASLQAHLAKLSLWLCGCDPAETWTHVAPLRAVMSRNATTAQQEAGVIEAYGSILSELPLWAVKRACKDYLTGKVGDGRFAPTPAEIAARCRALMVRYIEDRTRIERALGIERAASDEESLR